MGRVRLIHWNAAGATERVERLRTAGHTVDHRTFSGPEALRQLGDRPPAAVVIDLDRLPSHGRDVAMALRHRKATRHIPLVFAGGEAEKVKRIRELLPDAVYTSWSRVRGALRRAIERPVADPIAPKSALDGYSGRPLPRKLGIKADSTVALVGAPNDFEETLGELPEGVVFRRQLRGRFDLLIWFVRTRKELRRGMTRIVSHVQSGSLWIAWPKRTGGVESDLTQQKVREAGLASGLVDYKICAIDKVWSALLFTRRRAG